MLVFRVTAVTVAAGVVINVAVVVAAIGGGGACLVVGGLPSVFYVFHVFFWRVVYRAFYIVSYMCFILLLFDLEMFSISQMFIKICCFHFLMFM